MRLSVEQARRPLLWLALAAVALFVAGCHTSSQGRVLSISGPGWHTQEGQALWRPSRGRAEIGGELIMATGADGSCVMHFSKTPMPILLAQTTRTNWLIDFPARRLCFTGRGTPPTRLAWLYLPAALAGQPLPARFRFERKPEGGWRLENQRSGESLEGYLAP
jgi:hypothetical protein